MLPISCRAGKNHHEYGILQSRTMIGILIHPVSLHAAMLSRTTNAYLNKGVLSCQTSAISGAFDRKCQPLQRTSTSMPAHSALYPRASYRPYRSALRMSGKMADWGQPHLKLWVLFITMPATA